MKKKLAKFTKRECLAINTKGKKCIVSAKGGSDYCFRHVENKKR